MKRDYRVTPRMLSCRAGVLAILFLSAATLDADETHSTPAPDRSLGIPDFDDLTVERVRISPGGVELSDAGGQGLVSLDAPGATLSASVPLPAGGTSSNKSELVAAPIPFFSPSMGVGIGLGAAYIYNRSEERRGGKEG